MRYNVTCLRGVCTHVLFVIQPTLLEKVRCWDGDMLPQVCGSGEYHFVAKVSDTQHLCTKGVDSYCVRNGLLYTSLQESPSRERRFISV